MNKDPVTQATDRHHAEEADYQRRAEALTEEGYALTDEIYADLPAHLDEILEETPTVEALKKVLIAYVSCEYDAPHIHVHNTRRLFSSIEGIIDAAVKKIVERRLEP